MNTDATRDLFAHGIAAWAARVRARELSFRQTVELCLARASEFAWLDCFECLDAERALLAADGYDSLLASGTDLGPLMGLPTAIKDIICVDGLPTTYGSNAPTAALDQPEGSLMENLRRAGCIVLGKTRTVEFALGATGVNEARGTPWNPVDPTLHRIPGGSSSGSAVATAAGIVGLGIGTDTGGSVRIPACFTGLFGHKTSTGLWPLDGIFPLSATLDSAGPLCRTAADLTLVHRAVTGQSDAPLPALPGLRAAIVQPVFLEALDAEVSRDFARALDVLKAAGIHCVDLEFPGTREREQVFPPIVGAELISTLTPEGFKAARDGMDTVTAARASVGLDVSAVDYLKAQKRRQALAVDALASFDELDCWLSPTVPFVPMPIESLKNPADHARSLLASRNTQPANLYDFCALTIPMHKEGLPTGLQVMMPHGNDRQLLALGAALSALLEESEHAR